MFYKHLYYLFIYSLIEWSFCTESSNRKSWETAILKEYSPPTMCHMPCVKCNLSCVTCQMSHVTFFVFFFILLFLFFTKWRSYLLEGLLSTGLPHLVFSPVTKKWEEQFYFWIMLHCCLDPLFQFDLLNEWDKKVLFVCLNE